MRSCTARALLALVLLAVALEAVPTEQQTTVLQPLTLTATFNIEPGDAVAPHIYDWYFDGVDDYITTPAINTGRDASMITWFNAVRDGWIVSQGSTRPSRYYGRLSFRSAGTILYHYFILDPVGDYYTISGSGIARHQWYHAVATHYWDGARDNAELYVNGAVVSSNTFSGYLSGESQPFYLGSRYAVDNFFNGLISQFLLYSRALSDTEIAQAYNANIVGANGLVLFLDATFYNGTHYIDLSGRGNHGVGYGGVSRVLSSRPGLYLVKFLHGDGLVHFRFFPANTLVEVYDSSGSLVTWFVITGSANRAGLVEDYAVSLQAGTYRLVITVLIPGQAGQQALPPKPFVLAHFKAEIGPGCRVGLDYTAWPKMEPRVTCGLQSDVVFLTGLPAGALIKVWNGTAEYYTVASSTGVAVLGGLEPGAYEVKVYSDILQIPHDHLLRLDPLTGLRQFFGFWDRLTFNLFTPVFVVGLVLAVYLRTWSAVLTALVALATHIVIAPDNIWIRGLLALALAVAVYIAVWRRTTII
jgi:hypothetical protein